MLWIDQLRSWADNQVESDELLELGSDLKAESSIEQEEALNVVPSNLWMNSLIIKLTQRFI